MKIIQIVSYYPPHLGGMENVAKEISERLAKKGHDVEVFTSDIGSKKNKLESTKNLKINYLKSFEIANTPVIPSLFFKLLKISKDSIIHLHLAQAFIPEIVYLISKIRKIPYVVYIHIDLNPSGKLGFLIPAYKKIFLKKVLLSASKVIVPTIDYVRLISKKYNLPKKNICIVPCGIDLNNFHQSPADLHDPIRLLFVGRLQVQKNVPLLIKSFKYLVDNTKFNIELNIVGDGEDKDKIIQLINSLNLSNKIHLLKKLEKKSLYETYRNSDIFILTSKYESFGIVLVEAMASGLPIVASDITAVRNVVINKKTGLLSKLSEKDFAKNINKILSNTELRKILIANGLKDVKKYDWDKIIEKLEIIYKEESNEIN